MRKVLMMIRKRIALKKGVYLYGCDRRIKVGDMIGTNTVVINDAQFMNEDNRYLDFKEDYGRLFSLRPF